jgi:CBS domain-containing protein
VTAVEDLALEPIDVSVALDATFLEAAERLVESGLPALAVVDGNRRVVGFFGEDELLRGVFPRYLGELRHTAFTMDDISSLADRLAEVGSQPVTDHLRQALVVDERSSATHLAELLLHHEVTAVALERDQRFAGMVTERDFCRKLLARCRIGLG